MQVRMGLMNKKADWTFEMYRDYWRNSHGKLARQIPGLRSYQQNLVVDSEQRGFSFKRGPEQLEGISQLVFDDDAAMQAGMSAELGAALIADEQHFIGQLRIVTADQHVVVEPPAAGSALKRMSFLKRRADVSPEKFAREWREVHGPLVRSMPGILGYRQNLITGRQVPKGTVVDYESLPIDGIVELWFSDVESINATFGSRRGLETMAHAATFIDEITTFLVDSVTVI